MSIKRFHKASLPRTAALLLALCVAAFPAHARPSPAKVVEYSGPHEEGDIVVELGKRRLYLVQGDGTAIAYPVAVGSRKHPTPKGSHVVVDKRVWPAWHPTDNIRKEDPRLPKAVPGGPGNPLGARAIYLDGSLIRIHGTNRESSIGKPVTHGCIRMHKADIIDLYGRIGVGTPVHIE